MWSAAQLQMLSKWPANMILKETRTRLHEFSPCSLTSIVWAFCELGIQIESIATSFYKSFPKSEQFKVESLPPCSKARLSRASKYLDLDPNGGWGMWQNGTVFQSVRSHVWYFSLSACGPGNENMNNSTRQILFEARFLQADDSEFSIELKGMLTFHVMYI